MNQKVFNGNNIDLLKNYPDNYFDSIVTDPPYGLGKEPNASELMKDWIECGFHEISGKGFMGKEWDSFVPQPIFWKEIYRVLKPGGHILAFYGTRTYDWGVMSMRFAGFEVRDCIQWLYGSGFPKSHNIGKAIDKMQGNDRELLGVSMNGMSETAMKPDKGWNANSMGKEIKITKGNSDWEGWGTALKPANEPIVLARKPLEKGLSIAENILKWGVGGINIDASRIGASDKEQYENNTNRTNVKSHWANSNSKGSVEANINGRFPANIILTHHEDCECKGTKKVKAIKGGRIGNKNGAYSGIGAVGFSKEYSKGDGGYGDENGQEELENWDCHEDCPIRILDEQSGVSKSIISMRGEGGGGDKVQQLNYRQDSLRGHNDKGGASRFFYVAKASKAERNKGLDDFEEILTPITNFQADMGVEYRMENGYITGLKAQPSKSKNFHPTVKPIKLMQYLVKMITPPNGIVLDPFCGSGTTGVACKIDGFNFVGLEQDAEYTKIAEARINNYIIDPKQTEMF